MRKLHELIAKIFLASALLINPAKAETIAQTHQPRDKSLNEEIYAPSVDFQQSNRLPQLLLTHSQSSERTLLAGHRSHSSHRSHYSSGGGGHRSHSSHYSHYQNTTPSTPDSDKSQSTKPDTSDPSPSTPSYDKSRSRQPYTSDPSVENKTHDLGSRILTKGLRGPDVIELKKLLQTKGYTMGSDDLFDEYLEVVVKDFQKKNGIPADGQAGPLTIYYLKDKK